MARMQVIPAVYPPSSATPSLMVAKATILTHGSPDARILLPRRSPVSRRKVLARRGASGRIIPDRSAELLSPAEAKRLIDLAAAGLRDAIYSSIIGQLYLRNKISASEYAAGKRWFELSNDYSSACQSPPKPQSKVLDAVGGTSADPDSPAGIKEARRHERTCASYLEGRHALRLAGAKAERVVSAVCVEGQLPAGMNELSALRTGLRSLSAHWSARRKSAGR